MSLRRKPKSSQWLTGLTQLASQLLSTTLTLTLCQPLWPLWYFWNIPNMFSPPAFALAFPSFWTLFLKKCKGLTPQLLQICLRWHLHINYGIPSPQTCPLVYLRTSRIIYLAAIFWEWVCLFCFALFFLWSLCSGRMKAPWRNLDQSL